MRAEINFSKSHNSGLQMGENTGTVNATMNTTNTFAAGATVYLGKPFKISQGILEHYVPNQFSIQAAHPLKAPKTNFSML